MTGSQPATELQIVRLQLPFGRFSEARAGVRRGALGLVAALCCSASAQASTVQTFTQSLSHVADPINGFIETSVLSGVGITNSLDRTQNYGRFLDFTFDPFDATLGTLTGVQWYFDIQASLKTDSLYGCVGIISVGCNMVTNVDSTFTSSITAQERFEGFELINIGIGTIQVPTFSRARASIDPIEEKLEKSGSGLVGCVAQEVTGLGQGCLNEAEYSTEIQETVRDDDRLEMYTDGQVTGRFRADLALAISTECQLLGLVGSCYSRNFPNADVSTFISLNYEYESFAVEDPIGGDPAVIPLPPSLALLLTGLLGVAGLRLRGSRNARGAAPSVRA